MENLPSLDRFKRPTTKANSQRAEIISQFVDGYNANTNTRKASPRTIAVRLAHLSQQDLDAFLKQCKTARNFAAYFNWALKPQSCKPYSERK